VKTFLTQMTVLVAGCGSMGRRHLRNLRAMGASNLAAYDPDPECVAPLVSELSIRTFQDFDKAFQELRPNLVFICSPPVFHVGQALQAVRSGADVFVEKPLSHSTAEIVDLIAAARTYERVVQVGYNLRFHPAVRRLKQIVDEGLIGPILWARAEVGHYLPNWRPWQDHRQSYTARSDLGGGVILDLSHEIDYITWILGDPVEILCMAGQVSGLAVDVEDSASILLRFASGTHADIHMDCLQRSLTRVSKLVGENGTAHWDASTNEIKVQRPDSVDDIVRYECDANKPYIAEVRHFLECVQTRTTPMVDLRQAARIVELCTLARDIGQHSRVRA
jgi:predicted dehydrogenase